jgi:lipid-binding SYLF domain-containing protein
MSFVLGMFMTTQALRRFQRSSAWDVGGDASVTLVEVGANAAVDPSRIDKPIVALMAGVSLKEPRCPS